MVAFNFSPEFVPLIEAREKCQTIRKTRRANLGDALQLYTGQRTKACRKLLDPDPTCTLVDYVSIRPEYLTLGDTRKHAGNADDFAKRDGFADYGEMVAWFEKKYGSPFFQGYVHGWK